MRALNLDQLRTLVAIADLGTFAAAAQALHLAAPTVSLHISELESRLDAALLLRGKRGAQLTSAGQVLVQRGRVLLRDADEAIEQVRRHAQGRAGKVRLGSSTGVVVYLLPQVLAMLAQQYPDIDVEVSVLGSKETLARLEAGSLDLGVVTLPLPGASPLQCTPWRSDPMMAYLPADWVVPDAITPAWLADKPLIFNDSSTQMYRHTMSWFGQAGFSPTARIELNFTEAMKSLVVAGYGAAILPLEQEQAPHALGVHEAMQMRPLRPAMRRELVLVHPAHELLPAGALPVLEVLREFAQA
ncbi:LysR family transcriptional regulator [Roseateles oligotrophus]|uniref:LysR family transcriptional regulator n=1 Tax=Roseateles oligotrophus TaxID=1769250 RepID=A0ABT2YK25_9BURK|nr:LysR family transcriptional regulator [Roseateles oligotrophus]MCV2370409.1 LysR family transcriptional regulator [Roseateles oligotrophus]